MVAVRRYISVLGQYAMVALYAAAVLVHNLACLAWLVALMEGPENSWAAMVQWASGGEGGLPHASPPEQYLAGLYWVFTTVTTTGYGGCRGQLIKTDRIRLFFGWNIGRVMPQEFYDPGPKCYVVCLFQRNSRKLQIYSLICSVPA